MKARSDETWAQHQLKVGDIGVRVGWGVVSWLYAARDTFAAQGRSHTEAIAVFKQRRERAPDLALSSFSLFPFCLCLYGESDSEELSPSV